MGGQQRPPYEAHIDQKSEWVIECATERCERWEPQWQEGHEQRQQRLVTLGGLEEGKVKVAEAQEEKELRQKESMVNGALADPSKLRS